MSKPRSIGSLILCFVGLVVLTAADLGTKDWAEGSLSASRPTPVTAICPPGSSGSDYWSRVPTHEVVLIKNYLGFRYAENCGAAFGMMDEAPRWLRVAVFMVAGTTAIIALLWMFISGSGSKLFAWAVPLIASGALGNMIDRWRLGYVVDFVHFHIYDKFTYPTFNLADSTIFVGVALLVIDGLRKPAAPPETQAASV